MVPPVGAGVVHVGIAGGVVAIRVEAPLQPEGGHARGPIRHRVRQRCTLGPLLSFLMAFA